MPSTGPLVSLAPRHARGWRRWLPGLAVAREYRCEWLRHDLVAGLVLAAMLVPVGMAYAAAAGLPPVNGLYATIIPLLFYALFGPSRILVIGPDSALAGLIFAAVVPLSGGDPARAIVLAGAMALAAGLVCLIAGLARLGFLTELLSKPIRHGYMNGIAITILISQLPALCGVDAAADSLPEKALAFFAEAGRGGIDPASLAVGGGTLALILLLKPLRRVPGLLIAVVLAMLATWAWELDRHGVRALGDMPAGLPGFAFPWIGMADLAPILLGGVAVALLASAETSVLSRSYAARVGGRADQNQELVALGMANLGAGLFQGFPISSSASRTPVAETAGARTQLACVAGALAVALLLTTSPHFMAYLPEPALAAVVIAAAIGLFEITDLRRIYRIQRWEFWLSVGCSAGVVILGAVPGIGLAILMAVIEFLWDGWRPYYAVLGRVDGLKGYHDLRRHPDARTIPGLVLFRWDAPLFFANAELFADLVREAAAGAPGPVRWLVVAAEPVTSVDVTAADMLAELDAGLRAAGVQLRFAEMKDPVLDKLRRFGLFERFGAGAFFPTIGQAVSAYVGAHGVAWTDWEDRAAADRVSG